MSERVQEADSIINNFEIPEKIYDNVVLTKVGGKYTFTDVKHLDDSIEHVGNLDRNQQGYIFDRISGMISKHYGKNVRYRNFPLQKSFDLCHAKTSEGKKFKEHIMKPGWIWNNERLRKSAITALINDSLTYVDSEGNFNYEGEPVLITILNDNVFDTLAEADVFKKRAEKVYNRDFHFVNGESSVWSGWFAGGGCFGADTYRPSDRYSGDCAVAEKTDARVKIERVTVSKHECEGLKNDLLKPKAEPDKLKNKI